MGTTETTLFVICGITCHSIFYLRVNIPFNIISGADLRKFQQCLQDVKIFIIDKVYIMGKKMMYFIDQRLRQASEEMSESFEGFCWILVDNFQQLLPVGDKPIYEVCSDAYLLFDATETFLKLVESH